MKTRLCDEEKPDCSKCPIDTKLDCPTAQEENYENQFRYSSAGRARETFENNRQPGKY